MYFVLSIVVSSSTQLDQFQKDSERIFDKKSVLSKNNEEILGANLGTKRLSSTVVYVYYSLFMFRNYNRNFKYGI